MTPYFANLYLESCFFAVPDLSFVRLIFRSIKKFSFVVDVHLGREGRIDFYDRFIIFKSADEVGCSGGERIASYSVRFFATYAPGGSVMEGVGFDAEDAFQ